MNKYLTPVDQGGFAGIWKSLTTNSVDRANEMNRCVCEYQPCAIKTFFEPVGFQGSSIISGGDSRLRAQGIRAQVQAAAANGFPVVVLHEGDYYLESLLRQTVGPGGNYREVGTSSPCLEPFYDLKPLEVSRQSMESAPKEYELKINAQYYIEALCEYLRYANKKPSFQRMLACPHAQMFDKIDDLQMQGIISDSVGQDLKSKLMMGQSECYKLNSFWSALQMEAEPILYRSRTGFRPTNIVSAVRRREVICIDVSSVTNKLLMNTLFYQMKLALSQGGSYYLIIDSLPVAANEQYANFVRSAALKVQRLFASDDLFAMLGGDENLFATLLGDSQTVIIMSHASGKSATKWAEFLGQYDKYEKSYTQTRGGSRRSPFSPFQSPNYSRGVNISKTREFIVKPEMLSRMGQGEAYVRMADSNQIAHLLLNES